jgi:NAD(P)-dependent dehydrogenase (short-subunit alcohol dehydrogenase family)
MVKLAALDLSGKTALVTGASRGIGRAAALAIAKCGAHVIALARTVGGLEELDDDIRAAKGSASLVPLDLLDAAAVAQLGLTLAPRFSKLDIFVGAAGILGELAPIPDIAERVWLKTLETNLTANFRLLRTLDPMLRASGSARAVFLTSRVGGAEARAFWGAYAASKAGLEMLAKTYALETRILGVRVAILDPGPMRTKMRAEAMPGEDPAALPDPGDLAPLLLRLVSPSYDGSGERYEYRRWLEGAYSLSV